jgi:hypothetical protein
MATLRSGALHHNINVWKDQAGQQGQRPKGNEAALMQVQLRLPLLPDMPGWPGTPHNPACLANLLGLTSGSSLPHGKASA